MAKDVYHNLVRQALENEGWTITDDNVKLIIFDTQNPIIHEWKR